MRHPYNKGYSWVISPKKEGKEPKKKKKHIGSYEVIIYLHCFKRKDVLKIWEGMRLLFISGHFDWTARNIPKILVSNLLFTMNSQKQWWLKRLTISLGVNFWDKRIHWSDPKSNQRRTFRSTVGLGSHKNGQRRVPLLHFHSAQNQKHGKWKFPWPSKTTEFWVRLVVSDQLSFRWQHHCHWPSRLFACLGPLCWVLQSLILCMVNTCHPFVIDFFWVYNTETPTFN